MRRSDLAAQVALLQSTFTIFDSPQKQSTLILDLVEAAGMLPPETKLGLKDVEALRQWNTSDQIKVYHQWDKE